MEVYTEQAAQAKEENALEEKARRIDQLRKRTEDLSYRVERMASFVHGPRPDIPAQPEIGAKIVEVEPFHLNHSIARLELFFNQLEAAVRRLEFGD